MSAPHRKRSLPKSRRKRRAAPSRSASGRAPHPAPAAQVLSGGSARDVLSGLVLGAVFGKFTRLYAAIFVAVAGFVLSFAWTLGPQRLLDDTAFAKLTARAEARIVERWLAVEWKTRDAWLAPDWRQVAKATTCAVLEYDGDWGSRQRAFCGTRLPFFTHYEPLARDQVAPGVPFDWPRDASGLLVPEIRVAPATKRYLEATPAIVHAFPHITDAKNALELLQFELVSPTESAIRGWTSAPVTLSVAVDPKDPATAMPAGFIEKRGASKPGDGVGVVIAGGIGLAFWWAGVSMLLAHVPLLARSIMAVLPLLALPWWGDELPKYVERLNEDVAEVMEDMLGSVDRLGRLVASAPEEALLAQGERLSWKTVGAPYAETFGRLALAAPRPPVATPELALAALSATAAAQARAWPAAERVALFESLLVEKKRSLYGAGLVFLSAGREALMDPRGDPAVRAAAAAWLSEWLTQPVKDPRPDDPAFAQRVQLYRDLQQAPVNVIANLATFAVERSERSAAERERERERERAAARPAKR